MLGVHESFAGYQIEGILGQGGMGIVYLARHPRLPRLVALKLLHRAVSEDEGLRRRFQQEANIVAHLDHPGIVDIYDRGTQDGHLWLSMQYIRGIDAARLDPHTTTPDTIVRLITDTASALDYAHSRGVLHRDIKPANILISEPEAGRQTRAILTDFGIARMLDTDTDLTATGTFTATLAYASPEQLSGTPIDHRADQYSLACTLFTLLTGQTPYSSKNPAQVVTGHLTQPVPRLSTIRPDLPPALDHVLARAMAKHRDQRFTHCGEFAAATITALHNRPTTTRPTPAPHVLNQPPVPIQHPVPAIASWPRSAPTILNHQPGPIPHPVAAPAPWHPPPMGNPPRPSGAVARTAAALAYILSLFAATPTFLAVREYVKYNYSISDYEPFLLFFLFFSATVSLSLLIGSVSLWRRNHRGRNPVITGSAIIALIGMIIIGIALEENDPIPLLIGGASAILALTTLICALSRSTRRWLAYGRSGRYTHRAG
ncbi:serine/threonine-protein kinase [Nocardia sp. 004]|uniref:serine/threonine-protein kinase n=1 Tax=Nocardia sp. 004 TaxID=3385978 RepID=UPI0039A033E3